MSLKYSPSISCLLPTPTNFVFHIFLKYIVLQCKERWTNWLERRWFMVKDWRLGGGGGWVMCLKIETLHESECLKIIIRTIKRTHQISN